MSDVVLYLTLASSVLVILFVVALLRRSSSGQKEKQEQEEPRRPRNEANVQVRRVGGRVVRSRLHRPRTTFEEERTDEEDQAELHRFDDDDGEEELATKFPDEKIGAKKRKKLEMKAEKKMSQERETQMRSERKKRQELEDEQRKKDDEAARLEEDKKEELERLQKEEKERRENEEYLKLKASFAIESEGFDREEEDEGQDLLKEFVNYIKDEKVVLLEDLAARFKLKTQDAIDRVNSLMQSEDLIGVIDDRGKFIYISMDELQSVAKFVRQRGRVTISELAESSNVLIDMNPLKKNVDVAV